MISNNENLKFNSLLSCRKSLTHMEFGEEMKKLDKFILDNSLKVVGPKISTTYSISQAMVPTMDIEVLIPLEMEFTETTDYKFKPEFKLVNCLKLTHKGNPQGFNDSVMSLQKYITEEKLVPISTLYTVNIQEAKALDEAENFQADLYISISPNIL